MADSPEWKVAGARNFTVDTDAMDEAWDATKATEKGLDLLTKAGDTAERSRKSLESLL